MESIWRRSASGRAESRGLGRRALGLVVHGNEAAVPGGDLLRPALDVVSPRIRGERTNRVREDRTPHGEADVSVDTCTRPEPIVDALCRGPAGDRLRGLEPLGVDVVE